MSRIAAEFEVRASLIDVSAPHRRNHSPPPEVQPRSQSISRGTLQIRKMPSGIGKTHVFMQRPVGVGHDEITGFVDASHPVSRRRRPSADHRAGDGSRVVDPSRSRGLGLAQGYVF